jgi:hypothetical protein
MHLGVYPRRDVNGLPILADAGDDPDAAITVQECTASCRVADPNGPSTYTCLPTTPDDAGNPRVDCLASTSTCSQSAGRRHREVRGAPAAETSTLGDYLMELARLEAISVDAFTLLARDLEDHCAPASFVRAAERARGDEIRHARLLRSLAAARGAQPRVVEAPIWQPRSRFAVAEENLVEGCVHETFGALVARHQATFAPDPEIRRAMRLIARDEARHAAVARAVHDWLVPQLSPHEVAALAVAEECAWRDVATTTFDPIVALALGLPAPGAIGLLAHHLRAACSDIAA